jgi:hypothetical protein
MSYEPDQYAAYSERVVRRTSAPGLLLIFVGVLDLIPAAFFLYSAYVTLQMPPAEFRQQYEERMRAMRDALRPSLPEWADALEKQQGNPEDAQMQNGIAGLVTGGVLVLIGLLIILGGVRMRRLQSYGLALTGAILAAIPCLSIGACCGLGEIIGIWSFVVLMDPEVRAAFR